MPTLVLRTAAVICLAGAIGCSRAEPPLAAPESAAPAAAPSTAPDARSPDDASDAGVHVDPCARCRDDEYCAVTRKVPGVQRGGPLAVPWTTTVTCEKLPMPACAQRSCACLDMQQASCSLRDGKLRVERRVNLP
jgi:hypothetical protein